MNKIQISLTLYQDMINFITEAGENAVTDPDLYNRILNGIKAKQESQAARQLYTASKTAHNPNDREAARQAYLDHKGVPKSFRY